MKNIKAISFLLAVLMALSSFTISAFALEIEDASEDETTEEAAAAVTWDDVIAGMATPEEYCEANGVSDLSTELGGEASTANLTVEDGLYYINNKYTGKYMYYSSSSVTSKSGLTSSLGVNSRWKVSETDNGYIIHSAASATKYLAVSTSSTSGVEIVTVTSSQTIPDTCYWDMSVASGGGILIQSMYNSRYLYSTGTDLYTASSTGTSGTSTYYSRAWRFVSKSNMSSRELTSFTVNDCSMLAGNSSTPTINSTPSNAYWTQAYDFTYSDYSTSYFTFNSLTGIFTGVSSVTGVHYSKVIATHKVTGLTATFYLVINPRSVLIGVPSTGDDETHYHKEWIDDVDDILTDMGYTNHLGSYTTYTISKVISLIDDYTCSIFVSRSHGGATSSHTWILLSDTASTSNIIRLYSDGDIASTDLSNMKLMLFVGCKTGYGGNGGNNLPTAAVESGATTAVGFTENINCKKASNWTIEFFDLMSEGNSVSAACSTLAISSNYSSTNLTSYVICGSTSTKLT
ncbi:MAG: hypothetical protein LUE25_01350 [Clostridiales bacterium]|nr:hypothetical protein [Clostridiales bacterium]